MELRSLLINCVSKSIDECNDSIPCSVDDDHSLRGHTIDHRCDHVRTGSSQIRNLSRDAIDQCLQQSQQGLHHKRNTGLSGLNPFRQESLVSFTELGNVLDNRHDQLEQEVDNGIKNFRPDIPKSLEHTRNECRPDLHQFRHLLLHDLIHLADELPNGNPRHDYQFIHGWD